MAALLAGLCGGCVWMPDFDDPDPVRYPPEIDRTKAEPSLDLTAVITGPTPFSIANAVSDPDSPVELLTYAWYLGYPEGYDPRPVKSSLAASSWVLDPCREPVKTILTAPGKHLLEVLVVDEDSTLDTDIAGRTVFLTADPTLPGKYAYASWLVEFQGAPCP